MRQRTIVISALAILIFAQAASAFTFLQPQSIRDWRQAQKLFDNRRYTEAAITLRAWLADYRDSEDVLRPAVMFKLGECYRLTHDTERAIKVYNTIITMFAESPHKEVRRLVDEVVKPTLKDLTEPKEEQKAPEPEQKPAE